MSKTAKLQVLALAWLVLAGPAGAVDVIEAVGAQKCGGRVKSYAVEFLAPEDAQLEASAKAMAGGAEARPETVRLSLDGRPCRDARCTFRASKGQTYRFVAEGEPVTFSELCVVIARP
ncbi:MAG TPA: hypothetical protein VHG30_09655 [Microvirga sp.]|jgi:hypothetical protein|nr:hypothetical protein [Microvirga sp.]